ncbi:MAG TPA: ACT domain-containing protein [Mycobacteriales bacterium]|nr:ACT domain-containing protein [Mycobacteriales bacterium]
MTDATGTEEAVEVAVESTPLAPEASSVYVVDWVSAPDLGPILDATHLAVSRYPAGWRPEAPLVGFHVVIADDEETTLVCAESALDALPPPVASEGGWRRITFAGPLPWELVGFLADVAGRLASAGIPLAAMAGFTTDHVLVRAAHADLAVEVLRGHAPPARRPGLEP